MREIKFRAWDKYNKKLNGYYTRYEPERLSIIVDGMANCKDILPETVGQYTGLKDKNGLEIYEGDILGGIIGGYVVWIDKQARFGIDICGETNECRFEEFEQNDLEVIGNIYENKNLLEAQPNDR